MIKQAVPSGGDCGIALRPVEACDFPKRGKLGCVIFDRGGLRSRIPRTFNQTEIATLNYPLLDCRQVGGDSCNSQARKGSVVCTSY